jgi:hypothetical protein
MVLLNAASALLLLEPERPATHVNMDPSYFHTSYSVRKQYGFHESFRESIVCFPAISLHSENLARN